MMLTASEVHARRDAAAKKFKDDWDKEMQPHIDRLATHMGPWIKEIEERAARIKSDDHEV